MINQIIKVLFLFLALGATLLAAHMFRYDLIMEDPANGTLAVFDRLTGEARVCEIQGAGDSAFLFTCDDYWQSVISK
jgi:hypothetical protein